METLALERSDRPGLASFLASHLTCEGGIDIELRPGGDGSLIRVTCTDCGRAIEALAASWEGWWDEPTRDETAPTPGFEPRDSRPTRTLRKGALPRVQPTMVLAGVDTWRRRLAIGLISSWLAGGVVLLALAILAR